MKNRCSVESSGKSRPRYRKKYLGLFLFSYDHIRICLSGNESIPILRCAGKMDMIDSTVIQVRWSVFNYNFLISVLVRQEIFE